MLKVRLSLCAYLILQCICTWGWSAWTFSSDNNCVLNLIYDISKVENLWITSCVISSSESEDFWNCISIKLDMVSNLEQQNELWVDTNLLEICFRMSYYCLTPHYVLFSILKFVLELARLTPISPKLFFIILLVSLWKSQNTWWGHIYIRAAFLDFLKQKFDGLYWPWNQSRWPPPIAFE